MLFRFVNKINKTPTCWVWQGSIRKDGYGRFRINKQTLLAHRVAYHLFNGHITEGYDVCHTCDTPGCVNPTHLFLATHAENMQDKIRKLRDHNLKKTHCPSGHAYSFENTYRPPGSNSRACRTCRRNKCKKRREQ